MHPQLVWLHIKKSAGSSTRRALGPLYTVTDRTERPRCFAAAPRAEWNDVLNNYRVPLGDWQFRRSEFARRFLWPEDWDRKLRLAFAREPVSRCVSMFHYLFDYRTRHRNLDTYRRVSARTGRRRLARLLPARVFRRLPIRVEAEFDLFLDALEMQEAVRGRTANEAPFDLHFATHTNPMSNDVLDDEGRLNLTHLIRLESFEKGIDLVYRELGVERPAETRGVRVNGGGSGPRFRPSPEQRRRIERLYARDFDLYEDALAL
jgi:hypothetical protein